jgi:hypothetical protein
MTFRLDPRTKLPQNMPDYERASFLKKRLAEGWSNSEILDDYVRVFYANADKTTRKLRRDAFGRLLHRVRREPERWDPDMDEVLIDRAYMGDKTAWLSLSHYERRECLERLYRTYETAAEHPRYPGLDAGRGCAAWEREVGEVPTRVADYVNKRRERERKARSKAAA